MNFTLVFALVCLHFGPVSAAVFRHHTINGQSITPAWINPAWMSLANRLFFGSVSAAVSRRQTINGQSITPSSMNPVAWMESSAWMKPAGINLVQMMPTVHDSKAPAWVNPTNPRCGVVEPWSKHKPFEPTVGKNKAAKESQCHACKVRACNAGLPPPGEVGGCRCISYKDVGGNYATDCKNLLNKNMPVDHEKCGAVRDCDALKGQCVSAKFKMDSAKEAPWMKKGWKGAKSFGARAGGLSVLSVFGLVVLFGI